MNNEQKTRSFNLFDGPPKPTRVSLETLGLATAVFNQVSIPDGVFITEDIAANTITLSWPYGPGLTATITVRVAPTPPTIGQ